MPSQRVESMSFIVLAMRMLVNSMLRWLVDAASEVPVVEVWLET